MKPVGDVARSVETSSAIEGIQRPLRRGDTVYHMTGYCVHEMVLGNELPPASEDSTSTHCWIIQSKKRVAEFAAANALDLHTASLCFPRDRIANKGDIYRTKRAALGALIEYSQTNLHDAQRELDGLEEDGA